LNPRGRGDLLNIQDMVREIQDRHKVVGREEELRKALAAKLAQRHLMIEGNIGTGKTIIAKSLAAYFDQSFLRVDGDERFTEHKLVGYFDPPMIVKGGYSWDSFIEGPLTKAMKSGGILLINEINRLLETTQNVLLTAMDEGQIIIPKLGTVRAEDGFMIIATQNPSEYVGTTALSEALRDRFVWVWLDYQSEAEDKRIVQIWSQNRDHGQMETAVKIARRTRESNDLRRGSSVRGAIDMANIIMSFAATEEGWATAAIMSLATKIELMDGCGKTVEEVIRQCVRDVLRQDFR
jgi:MoxR-like ATPase